MSRIWNQFRADKDMRATFQIILGAYRMYKNALRLPYLHPSRGISRETTVEIRTDYTV